MAKPKSSHIAAVPKDDPKDKIEVEIGDSKQPDFKPQVKLMRWDNEVNMSFRLKDTDFDGVVPIDEDSKTKLKTNDKEIHFYDLPPSEELPEGGYEMEVILNKKPKSNVLEFTIETKGLNFFYQGELAEEALDRGDVRPENVIGSYAVYHKTEGRLNDAAGMKYRAGKAFHIYRPKVVDSVGEWVWGELYIDSSAGVQTITIPQSFLDKAVYPVRHASGEVLSYDTIGGTLGGDSATGTVNGNKATATENGTVTEMSLYCRDYSQTDTQMGLYSISGTTGTRVDPLSADITDSHATDQWYDHSVSNASIVASTEYLVSRVATVRGMKGNYDSIGSSVYCTVSGGDFPASGTVGSCQDITFSMYATYTPSGPGAAVQDVIGSGIIAFDR